MATRIVSRIKQAALSRYGNTAGPRTILFGLNRGVRMDLDLASETQTYLGLAERELAPYFDKYSRDIQTAIDVGGSVGLYALFFLKKTPAQRVICFEPDAGCFHTIERNLELNGLRGDRRLELINKFVGSKDDGEFVSLDSLADGVAGPCLIKIDVEEAEVDVLKGASRMVARPDVRWIIETHTATIERECLAIFRAAGRNPRIVDKAWWRIALPELRPTPHNRWLVVE